MTGPKDWDRELAKIERQIGSMSDADLLQAKSKQQLEGQPARVPQLTTTPSVAKTPGKWAAWLRVGLAVAIGVALVFWPYGTRCGFPLVGFLGGTVLTGAAAIWGAVASWKARRPFAHTIAIAALLWSIGLTAFQVLPKIGYAIPSEARPAVWWC